MTQNIFEIFDKNVARFPRNFVMRQIRPIFNYCEERWEKYTNIEARKLCVYWLYLCSPHKCDLGHFKNDDLHKH